MNTTAVKKPSTRGYRRTASRSSERSEEAPSEDPFELYRRSGKERYYRSASKELQHEHQENFENKQLCAPCQSIFQDHQELDQYGDGKEQKHHSEHAAFKDAVEAGCYVCSLLAQKIALSIPEPQLDACENEQYQPQFDHLTFQIAHQDFEPYINFTYYQLNGHEQRHVLTLRLFHLSGKHERLALGCERILIR